MRSLGLNALYNVLYRCFNVLFPLITITYVSRVLMPVGIGKVASAQNIVSYFVVLAALGLPTYGVKKIAECMDDRNKCSKIFSELFWINCLSTIICSVAYLCMIFVIDYFNDKFLLTIVVGIHLFANIINIDWLYQGLENYKYIMVRSLIVKIVSLIAIFIFVRQESDYVVYAFIATLGLVFNYIFNIVNLCKHVRLQLHDLDIIPHLRPVFILLATTIAIEIYTLADTTMLNLLKGDEIVGYYTNSAKAVAITRSMIAAACAVFLPRLNFYFSHNQVEEFNRLAMKGLSILLNFSFPAAIALLILADDCTFILFGQEFESSILSMRILTLSIITIAISNFTGYQVLVTLGKESIVLYSTIIGAIINVLLNSLLILPYGHYGAAIASVITEGIIALYQIYYVSKYIQINSLKKMIPSLLIPTLSLAVMMLLVKHLIDNIYVELISALLLGGLTFLVIGYYKKNILSIMLLGRIKKDTK